MKNDRTSVHLDEDGNIKVSCECERIRPEIYGFAQSMELKMKINDEKKGDSYKTCDLEYLEKKLDEEIEEYKKEKKHGVKAREAVDIANLAMILNYRHNKIYFEEGAERLGHI
jgi:hypothetical protein